MKKLLTLVTLAALTSCAAGGAGGWHARGFLYSDTKSPAWDLEVQSESTATRSVGKATCVSILGLIATGDCTVETAKKDGNITKVSSVQFDYKNILGVYAETTTKVYGN